MSTLAICPSSYSSDGIDVDLPWRIDLHRVSCLLSSSNKANFIRLTVASRGSCGRTNVTVMYSLILCSV
ncbi:hypothetical protein DPMN_156367 [Dreissena polymorpha]|uniref:Uncharacterized protein n=1 Tax=Dreissena polymorpha TaxID=45954 RepID=A0A9D4FPN8_DREPO|nr:hypothetical protein DPMN_156367 [Dreissena polymorpha]